MSQAKKAESSSRNRYIRALERFHKQITSYLYTAGEITKDKFILKVESAQKLLEKTPEATIYKSDLLDLVKLNRRIIELSKSDLDLEEIKKEILYSSNQLQKSINSKKYKKSKSSSLDDEFY
ncbi:MAG: hypothetical protein WCR69_05090 [Sulfuricurvum sp.]